MVLISTLFVCLPTCLPLLSTTPPPFNRNNIERRTRRRRRIVSSIEPIDSDPFINLPQIVSDYKLTHIISRDDATVIYHARNNNDDSSVTCKTLSLSSLSSWNALDRLNYEGDILRRLAHESIPTYIDLFQVDTLNDCIYILVTSCIRGQSLQNLMLNHSSLSSNGIHCIFTKLLYTLDYLSSLVPPVQHSNLNPHTIFVSNHDGEDDDHINITLFDFSNDSNNNNDDLYDLAILIVHIISRQPPEFFPLTDTGTPDLPKLLPSSFTNQYPSTYRVLQRILHPIPSHRLQTLPQTLSLLNTPITPIPPINIPTSTSSIPHVTSVRDDISNTLTLKLHPKGTTLSTITGTFFALIWTALSLSIAAGPAITISSRLISGMFAFGAYPILSSTFKQRIYQSTIYLTICPVNHIVSLYREDSLHKKRNQDIDIVYNVHVSFSFLVRASITIVSDSVGMSTSSNEQITEVLMLSDGAERHLFSSLPLTRNEMTWFKYEINNFLDVHILKKFHFNSL